MPLGDEMLFNLELYRNLDKKIEELVEENGLDYIDAVVDYCNKNNLEIEAIAEIIQKLPNLKLKIEIEAEELHYLKKTTRLPI